MIDILTHDIAGAKRPAFRLTLTRNDSFDKDLTVDIAKRLMSLTVTDNRGFEADTLELTLDDADGEIQLPVRGHILRLSMGWQGKILTEMGTFIVDQVRHHGAPDQLVIAARSIDFRSEMTTDKERSWHDMTLGDIVNDIAWRNKLDALVPQELSSIKIAHIDQAKESDISFLSRLAMRNGAEIAVKSGKIFFLIPGQCIRGIKNVAEVTITRSEGDSHEFTIADRNVYGAVIARWQDTKTPTKQIKQIKLTRKMSDSPGASDYTAGAKDKVFTLPTQYASQAEATRAAESEWSAMQRTAATFNIMLAEGRTDISPETPVSVSGFKKVINDMPWVIKKVTHAINNSGFITSLDLEVKPGEVEYEVQQ